MSKTNAHDEKQFEFEGITNHKPGISTTPTMPMRVFSVSLRHEFKKDDPNRLEKKQKEWQRGFKPLYRTLSMQK